MNVAMIGKNLIRAVVSLLSQDVSTNLGNSCKLLARIILWSAGCPIDDYHGKQNAEYYKVQ